MTDEQTSSGGIYGQGYRAGMERGRQLERVRIIKLIRKHDSENSRGVSHIHVGVWRELIELIETLSDPRRRRRKP